MSNLLPKDKSSYRFYESYGDGTSRRRNWTGFEHDEPNAYEIEADDYIVWIVTDEEESHYCWTLVYTEGDCGNITDSCYEDVLESWGEFATFDECVDDVNRAISKQNDDFFRKSKYDWHTERLPNGDVEGALYMRDKQGAKLGLRVSKLHGRTEYPCSLWNYDRHVRYCNWENESKMLVLEDLMDKYLMDHLDPLAKDISDLDDFVDELQSATGITLSKRY